MKRILALLSVAVAMSAYAAERVVTLSPHLAELVCAAGACSKLVGVVAYSDYPPEVMRLPQVGDAFNLDLERLLSLKPDLVLAWGGGSSAQTVARLRALGIAVESLRVRRLDEIAGVLEQIGAQLQTAAVAHQAAQAVRARLRQLRARHRAAAPLKVFYEVQADPLYTINADSPISEAIGLCGGVNVFAGIGALAGTVSLEAVFAADPDVVIYAAQDSAAAADFWRRHGQLRAVAAGRAYAVDADLLARATPRMLDGVEQLCAALERARGRPLDPHR